MAGFGCWLWQLICFIDTCQNHFCSAGGGFAAGSPFWVTTGYAGGATQPGVNVNSVPGYKTQVLAEMLAQSLLSRLAIVFYVVNVAQTHSHHVLAS